MALLYRSCLCGLKISLVFFYFSTFLFICLLISLFVILFTGELPYKKERGACRKFSKELIDGAMILICECGLKFFSPLRGINSKSTHHHLSYFFGSIPYGYGSCEAVHSEGSLRDNYLNPKWYDKQPRFFIDIFFKTKHFISILVFFHRYNICKDKNQPCDTLGMLIYSQLCIMSRATSYRQ